MPVGTEVDLGPGDFVFVEDPAPREKGAQAHSPHLMFGPCLCGKTAGWLKTPLGREEDQATLC